MSQREVHGQERSVWRSDCCGARMYTAGGDGCWGSPCWDVCRACGQACEPTPICPTKESEPVSPLVPLQTAAEALADVLVGYNLPAKRIVADFRETVAVYMEAE